MRAPIELYIFDKRVNVRINETMYSDLHYPVSMNLPLASTSQPLSVSTSPSSFSSSSGSSVSGSETTGQTTESNLTTTTTTTTTGLPMTGLSTLSTGTTTTSLPTTGLTTIPSSLTSLPPTTMTELNRPTITGPSTTTFNQPHVWSPLSSVPSSCATTSSIQSHNLFPRFVPEGSIGSISRPEFYWPGNRSPVIDTKSVARSSYTQSPAKGQ